MIPFNQQGPLLTGLAQAGGFGVALFFVLSA